METSSSSILVAIEMTAIIEKEQFLNTFLYVFCILTNTKQNPLALDTHFQKDL